MCSGYLTGWAMRSSSRYENAFNGSRPRSYDVSRARAGPTPGAGSHVAGWRHEALELALEQPGERQRGQIAVLRRHDLHADRQPAGREAAGATVDGRKNTPE